MANTAMAEARDLAVDLKELGGRIRKRRIEKGLTLVDLAYRIGGETAQLSKIELGKSEPELRTLLRIAVALGTTVGRLMPCRRGGTQP